MDGRLTVHRRTNVLYSLYTIINIISMKTTNRLISLFAAILTTTTMLADVVYEPLIVDSGFNRDVIKEVGSDTAISALYFAGMTSCFGTQSYIAQCNSALESTQPEVFARTVRSGWPDDYRDTIRCNTEWGADALNYAPYNDPKLFWLLAPYTAKNALCIRPTKAGDENLSNDDPNKGFQGEGTLKFKKIGCYDRLFFLLVSLRKGTVANRVVTTTIYYTDGQSTSTPFTLTGGLSGEAGHKARMTNIYETTFNKNKIEGKEAAYAEVFDIVVDHTKLIDHITFSNPITNSSVTILAVTGRTADVEIPDEESMAVSNIDTTSFQACWDAIEDATYRLDVAEDIDFQHILARFNNKEIDEGTCAEVDSLLSNHDYYWRVRAVDSDGGQSASSAPHRVTTAPDPKKGDTPPYTDEEYTNIEDMLAPYIGTKSILAELDIHRTLYRDGAFNTLCLPFDLNAAQIAASPLAGVDVYEYVRATQAANGQLDIEISGPIDHMTAGVPYLVKWAPTTPEIIGDEDGDGIGVLAFKNVNVVTNHGTTLGEEGEVRFVGNIGIATMVEEEQLGQDHNKLFLGAANTLYWPVDNTHLKGFRAYFLVPTTGPAAAPKHTPARIVMHTDVTTDVVTVNDERLTTSVTKILRDGQMYLLHKGQIYDVMGRKLSHNP